MADLKLIETNTVSTLQIIAALKKVYDHEPKNLPSLPAATLFFDGFSQQDQASRRKSVIWRWMMRVYVPLRDEEKAQNDVKTLLLDIMKEMRKNPQLGGTCLYHNISSGEIFVDMDKSNPHLMAELVLEATTQEDY